jgi:hypothetical protein
MIDWDIVRKNRLMAKRGTSDDKEIIVAFASMWRKPIKSQTSKAELRKQAAEADREWRLQHQNVPLITNVTAASSNMAC